MNQIKNSKKFLGYMKDIVCKGCINLEKDKCFVGYKITIKSKLFFCKSYVNKNIIFEM